MQAGHLEQIFPFIPHFNPMTLGVCSHFTEEESEAQRGQATSPRMHSREATDQGVGSSCMDSRTQSLARDTSLPLSPHLCLHFVSMAMVLVQASLSPSPWATTPASSMGLMLPISLGFFSHSPTQQPSMAPQHLGVLSQGLHHQHNASGPTPCS